MFVVLTLLMAYNRESIIRMIKTSQLPYEVIESRQDLENVLSQRNAFVFVKRDLRSTSTFAQLKVDEYATDWSWNQRKPDVKFYLFDTTDPEDQDRACEWARTDRKLIPLYSNTGGFAIWLRDGKVLQLMHGSEYTRDFLTEETKKLFQD